MGRRDRRELVSRLKILLGHLLKWQHQPPRRKQCGARFPSWSKGCVYAIFCRTLPACDQSLRRLSPQRTAMVGDWRARKPDRRDRISRISRLSRLTPCWTMIGYPTSASSCFGRPSRERLSGRGSLARIRARVAAQSAPPTDFSVLGACGTCVGAGWMPQSDPDCRTPHNGRAPMSRPAIKVEGRRKQDMVGSAKQHRRCTNAQMHGIPARSLGRTTLA